ncbi:NAD(P)-dependent oxidoreductase [Streptomyces sp. NPDC005374]|uniref:NAD(P)-dependent oxidoreductase n=1 Tax=Streptomyces sp. NPDC005374 TaxID=3364713 RepID=UPI0036B5DC62
MDEAALVDALDSGRVGFAALDVFETEPLPAASPLWEHDGVLISRHTAAVAWHAVAQAGDLRGKRVLVVGSGPSAPSPSRWRHEGAPLTS